MEVIPTEQYGFIPGKSMVQAVQSVLEYIEDSINKPKGHVFAALIDYKKAFDGINRNILMQKLEAVLGPEDQFYNLIKNIMKTNIINISDGLLESPDIVQTNGVLQGDPLSPIMFNLVTHDVVQRVATQDVKMYLYADMVVLSNNRTSLQEAINNLVVWSQDNDMQINQNKTKIMKFRKGENYPQRTSLSAKIKLLK
ncbi:hypothetical protein ANN_19117 [Periplaneta americana]|uniref:Reverse transcriptase domain-containing protein n=1 Tax=Periplaneta americana TaxID=6978 RepID=A0ABQ8S8Z6_PERAM|nr:hypothetical protein ANN_19117 [Periplaneta americana]